MAEYNMTYDDLKNYIDECIDRVEYKTDLSEHKTEILAALTINENKDHCAAQDMLSLWENQIGMPSELLLGTRYIRIKDSMIAFLNAAFSSGLADALISANPVEGLTVGVVSGVFCALIELFRTVSELSDFDFCIYMQAVCHYRTHKLFTKNDLYEWFPHGGSLICNMHNSTWDCEHIENDKCLMTADNRIDRALDSLEKKGLLKIESHAKQDFCKFPY